MFNSNTDKEWERFGKENPYFGVITDEKFKTQHLTDEIKNDFFQSGHAHLQHVLDNIQKHIEPNINIERALDFGCGVGRVTIPLAEKANQVIGVDVSPHMLEEARKNCIERSIKNVSFYLSDDQLTAVKGPFDFIHSMIVFQHIPVQRGEKIFSTLLNMLSEKGIGVIHFSYAKNHHYIKKITPWVKNYIPFAKQIINLLNRRPLTAPQMIMNPYNLNKILTILQKAKVRNLYIEFTDDSGELGVVIYFQKN